MTRSTIVVGVDFSSESDLAIGHAMEIARHTGAGLMLIHVGLVPDAAADSVAVELARERLEEVRTQLAALHQRLSGQGVEVSQLLVDGHADTALGEAARELGAELLVVGTHGRTGFRRILLGSVAEKTARLADANVLVARGDPSPGGYRRVVVGTDYSPLAQRALLHALELTAPGGDVVVVHAWAAPYLQYDVHDRVLDRLRGHAEVVAARERERILAVECPPGVTVRFELSAGAPTAVLEVLSGSADLVAIGSYGHRGLRRFLLGSVAEATIRSAHCTVLVAR